MILDAHVHLIDPARPQGVPFPDKADPLYRPTLPHHLRAIAGPLGVGGAIAIEWSTWTEDNQWLLDLADADPYVAGVVGNLGAGTTGFGARLERFARHPRFVGIRAGTPWCPLDLANPQFIADMELLAGTGRALDAVTVGGGGAALLRAVAALAGSVPGLRIIVDHLPFTVPADPAVQAENERALRVVAELPQVYAKLSNVLPRSGPIPEDPDAYAPIVDRLLTLFGPDRLMYASNWPVSTRVAPYDRALKVLGDYFARGRPDLGGKFFSANAQAAYRIA